MEFKTSKKPTIIFTTFWNGRSIFNNGGFYHENNFVKFESDDVEIKSISLVNPDGFSLTNLKFLTPTWDMVKSYKMERDWDKFSLDYKKVLIKNKNEVASWVSSLEDSKVYILCCWENTKKGANCHRKILFNALRASKRTKDLASFIYRDGDISELNLDKQYLTVVNAINNSSNCFTDLSTEISCGKKGVILIGNSFHNVNVKYQPGNNYEIDGTSDPLLSFAIENFDYDYLRVVLSTQDSFEVSIDGFGWYMVHVYNNKEYNIFSLMESNDRRSSGFWSNNIVSLERDNEDT